MSKKHDSQIEKIKINECKNCNGTGVEFVDIPTIDENGMSVSLLNAGFCGKCIIHDTKQIKENKNEQETI